MIITTCCAILTSGRRSNFGCTVAVVACLCHIASDPKLIVLSLAATKEAENEKDLSMLVPGFDGQPLPEIGPSPVVLCLPFSHLYFAKCFNFWARDYDFELFCCRHVRGIFAGWHNVKLLAILPSHRPSDYVETPGWGRDLEGSLLLCVPTPPDIAYYSGNILRHQLCQDLVWCIATLEFVICIFT